MDAVIYKRTVIENGSLLLSVFTQDGKTRKLKIPGILKSKTRNAYFLTPATIWSFTLTGNEHEIMIPKEYTLLHSPYEFNAPYSDLVDLGEFIKPLFYIKPDLEIIPMFRDLSVALHKWTITGKENRPTLTNQFYLNYLHHMGLLNHSLKCVHCDTLLKESDSYHLFSGSICKSCLKDQSYKLEELIPNFWITQNLAGLPCGEEIARSETDFRNRILMYIKLSV